LSHLFISFLSLAFHKFHPNSVSSSFNPPTPQRVKVEEDVKKCILSLASSIDAGRGTTKERKIRCTIDLLQKN
jgi:hypothetical protein